MGLEKSSKNIGTTGFTLGLVISVPVWVLTGTFFEVGANITLTFGVAAGIITGSICALALIKKWLGEREILVVPFGMGWGTLVGIAVGVLIGWSTSISFFNGFSVGVWSGFISGISVGAFLWFSIHR
ncbi:MAG: hypothetical protein ACOC55_03545 [Candidatus Natronoplasma sp.]